MKFREDSSANSKDFLRLKDKDTVMGVCAGDLYEFNTHWNGKQDEICSKDENCKFCNEGTKPRFRFRVNFITKNADGHYEAKMLELGWTVYTNLRTLNDEYDLQKHLIKISRRGSGVNDTEYTVVPVNNGKLDEGKLETISKVKLLDLKAPEAQRDKPAESGFNPDEELPNF